MILLTQSSNFLSQYHALPRGDHWFSLLAVENAEL